MRYEIIQHPLFEADLLHIHRLIEDYGGQRPADRKISDIVAFVSRLTDFPMIGTVRADIAPGLRAISASGKAVLCFVVDETSRRVRILCVSYGGADWHAMVAERHEDF